ncbi:MAG TPA: glutamate--tRNA ligase, partial [Actinomycetota bacterium]|nr:glutamate--tRNA ligase [Actinomycetota bacterium]
RLVGEFTLDRVQPHGAIFDRQKLDWMNQEYIKALSPDELRSRVLELCPDTHTNALSAAIEHELIQTRVVRLSEVPQAISYLSARPPIDPNAWDQFMSGGQADATLEATATKLESLEPWTVDAIKDAIQSLVADLGLHKRKGPQPIRIAISGTTVSLPLFESIYIIGRAESVARLRAAREVSVSPAG